MDEELETIQTGIYWDKPLYFLNGQQILPRIQERPHLNQTKPEEFNAVRLEIDGRYQSDLNWKQAHEEARKYIERGYRIFWEINLGLFAELAFDLEHQTQYRSLGLSLEHFRDTLWKEFGEHSLGVCVHRGSADFSNGFPWNPSQVDHLRKWLQDVIKEEKEIGNVSFEEMMPEILESTLIGKRLLSCFCRDASMEYLALLTGRLPDEMPRYLLLDVPSYMDAAWQVQVLHPECFEMFGLALKGSVLPFQALGWENESPYGWISERSLPGVSLTDAVVGVCLPSAVYCAQPSKMDKLKEVLEDLLVKRVPFRVIAEGHMLAQWDGLDYMIYVSENLGFQGKRNLQGFCAAGGTVVAVGDKMGFVHEIEWSEFGLD